MIPTRLQLARLAGRLRAKTGREWRADGFDACTMTMDFGVKVAPHTWLTMEVDASRPIRDHELDALEGDALVGALCSYWGCTEFPR